MTKFKNIEEMEYAAGKDESHSVKMQLSDGANWLRVVCAGPGIYQYFNDAMGRAWECNRGEAIRLFELFRSIHPE